MIVVQQAYAITYDDRTDQREPLAEKCLSAVQRDRMAAQLNDGRAKILGTLTGWPGATHTVRCWGRHWHASLSGV